MTPRSHLATQGRDRAPNRGMLRALGMTDEDFRHRQPGGDEPVAIERKSALSEHHAQAFADIVGRENVSAYRWNVRDGAPEADTSLGVLPSIGVNVEF